MKTYLCYRISVSEAKSSVSTKQRFHSYSSIITHQGRETIMISSISSTLSALQAFGKKMGVTANNVANVQSDEFKKSRAVLQEGERNEVKVEIDKIETPGPIITEIEDDEMVEKELSNVDLAEEIPQTIIAQRSYEANIKTAQALDETLETIIDIKG